MKAFLLDEPKVEVTNEELEALGVLNWKIDADNYEKEGLLDKICEERKYGHRSIVNISPETLPNYDQMIQKFFEEHLHEYEEIRFILEGSGYFDIRNVEDEWVRIHVVKGDLIILPAGSYHRFGLDDKKYIKAMRLFLSELKEPVWIPINRPQNMNIIEQSSPDKLECRTKYLETLHHNEIKRLRKEMRQLKRTLFELVGSSSNGHQKSSPEQHTLTKKQRVQ